MTPPNHLSSIPLFLSLIISGCAGAIGDADHETDFDADAGARAGSRCDPDTRSFELPLSPGFQGWCIPGDGIVTGAYSSKWTGHARTTWGNAGEYFSVSWRNSQPTSETSHEEFDISHKRDLWQSSEQGYGLVPLRDVLRQELVMSQRSKWDYAPSGKLHVNVIIWLNKNRESEARAGGSSIDITISEWFHKGKEEYKISPPSGTVHLGSTQHAGSTYHVFRRPGDLSERASYLIIRDSNRTVGRVDPGHFLRWLLTYEEQSGDRTFNDSWYISSMGWEVTGQAAGYDDHIGNSAGAYTFNCYSIPSLNGVENGAAYELCAGSENSSDGTSGGDSQSDTVPAGSFVFARTDASEYRWITKTSSGANGSIWISPSCAEALGGPDFYGDWSKLMEVAPAHDGVSNPCTAHPAGYVFSRTDTSELRWIEKNSEGIYGSIAITQSCANSLGGPQAYGDWFELSALAPAQDTIANPCP